MNDRQTYERQLKRMLDDPDGREVVGQALGLKVQHQEDLKDKAIVAVLTPAYRSLHPNMLDARSRLLAYSQQFCSAYSEPILGSSVVCWVRNDMIAALYRERKKFTHVLYIDDDMEFPPDSLVRMLRHEKDIVGCAYTVRADPPLPNLHLCGIHNHVARRVLGWEQPGLLRDDDLITAANPDETLTVGTGLVLYSRAVIDRVGEMYLNFEYERKIYGLTDAQVATLADGRKKGCELTHNRFWFQFLPRMTGWGESGEDTSFCLKAALCGFRTYADVSIQPGHIGEYSYSYKDFEPFQEEQIRKARSLGAWEPIKEKANGSMAR